MGQWATLGSDFGSVHLRYHLKKFLIQIEGNGEGEKYSLREKCRLSWEDFKALFS